MQGHRFSEDRPESFGESAERKLPVEVGMSQRRKWPLRTADKEIAFTKHSVPQLFPLSLHLLSFQRQKLFFFTLSSYFLFFAHTKLKCACLKESTRKQGIKKQIRRNAGLKTSNNNKQTNNKTFILFCASTRLNYFLNPFFPLNFQCKFTKNKTSLTRKE